MDAAILAGQDAQAALLKKAGAVSSFGVDCGSGGGPPGCPMHYFLLECQSSKPSFKLDEQAITSAISAEVPVHRFTMDVAQIYFGYPMRKVQKRFLLLDVAICLGDSQLALKLARLGADELAVEAPSLGGISGLTEAHLSGTEALFPLPFWTRENKRKLQSESRRDMVVAATAAAAVLDRARVNVAMSYTLLLGQWGRWFSRSNNGCVQLNSSTLLRHVVTYALPDLLLRLPRIVHFVNTNYVRPGAQQLQLQRNVGAEALCEHVRSFIAEGGLQNGER